MLAHLLNRGVFNSVGAIMIVDYVKVTDHLSLGGSSELSVKPSFACSLGVHSQVSGFVQLHTLKRNNSTGNSPLKQNWRVKNFSLLIQLPTY